MPNQHDDLFSKIAVERGYATQGQMDRVRAQQAVTEEQTGLAVPLSRLVREQGFLTEDQVAEVERSVSVASGEARRVGRYDIVSKIGTGGMGSVYLAVDPMLDRKVALKVLPPSLATEEMVVRFRMEAKLAAKLKHPNIAALHDFGHDPIHDFYYLAMEFMEGRDLGAMLKSGDQPPLPVSLRVFLTIAGALHHAHEMGIIHRDVKPENIIVTPSGQPAIIDFGLAIPTSGDTITKEGHFVGSPFYASPEQAKTINVTPRADLYSFGATIYHALSGQPVFAGSSTAEVLHMHVEAQADMGPLHAVAPEYVVSIVAKCLRKNPEDRYQTADEVRRALEAAIEHLEMSESDTIAVTPPAPGKTVLLHVEYQEANLAGAYREYAWGERLGGGTYGEVWRATQAQAGRDVAVKILRNEWVEDREMVARFRREATVLSRFEHENIVRVHNYGRWGSSFFIEMELVEGPDLAKLISEKAPMTPADAVRYVTPVLDGLAALHDAGAMHRDLKPENVKVAGDRVVVIDLGMAGGRDLQTITMSAKFMGTPRYAAPEQCKGDPQAASDVYAAGVILYELLTSHRPHEAETTLHLIHMKVYEPPKPITEYRDDLPAALVDAVHAMLATDPAARPSAVDAKRSLAGFVP